MANPNVLIVLPDFLPPDLRELDRWVVWKLERRDKESKPTKVPYQLDGSKASHSNPQHWVSFSEAFATYRRRDDFGRTEYNGIGFVLVEQDDLIAVDLDECIDGTNIKPWAQEVIDQLDTYTEYSPSGRGIHMFLRGRLPPEGRRKGKIEIYESVRFLTMTGHQVESTSGTIQDRHDQILQLHAKIWPPASTDVDEQPATPPKATSTLEDEEILDATRQAEGAIFERLYTGDDSDPEIKNDTSAGDHVFCKMLARQTDDPDQIARLLCNSGRTRGKLSRHDYRDRTIRKAISEVATEKESLPSLLDGADGHSYTDHGNAQRLIARHGRSIRYVDTWNKWLVYRKGQWVTDVQAKRTSHLAYQISDVLLEHLSSVFGNDAKTKSLLGWAKRCKSASTIRAALDVTGSDPRILLDPDDLDADPWLLNVRNGTIDLRTGELRRHDPVDLIMMKAGVEYDPNAAAPQWEAHLHRVIPDPKIRRLLQRLAALALVGRQRKHYFPILWGDGANGKSTITEVIAGVLGDYATAVSHDL